MSDVDPKLSFYKKMKKVSDVGKDTYVKIGDVLIIYYFVHLAEQSDDLVGLAKWQIFNALRNTSASHKEVAPVVQLKNYNRKDSNVVNRSSS